VSTPTEAENATSPPRPRLSIVIPAYNEAQRLPSTLAEIASFLTSKSYAAEIVVANDGSEDQTSAVARSFECSPVEIRVLDLLHRGKAAAVRDGVVAARGDYVLFTDADLSTPILYADDLLEALDAGADVAIGSREGAQARRIGEPIYRHLMGRVFNLMVQVVAVPGINDTQCGFKAFTRPAGRSIFRRTRLHVRKQVRGPMVTAFDVETLFIARRMNLRIVEIPVSWKHVSGSKVNPILDSARMFRDVLQVRYFAMRGRYN
jgi:glycosyltransferase involved in cell wall biosynthesis